MFVSKQRKFIISEWKKRENTRNANRLTLIQLVGSPLTLYESKFETLMQHQLFKRD